jgi:hypothetical protein
MVYKGKVVSAHTMKMYRRSIGITPLILDLGTRWRRVVNFTSQTLYSLGKTSVPNEQEAGFAPEPVWTFWRREKSVATAGIQTPDCTTHSLTAISTTLYQLRFVCSTVL